MNKENKSQNSKLNIDAEESGCLSYFINHETLLNERYLTDLTNEFRNAGVKFGEEYETFVRFQPFFPRCHFKFYYKLD